jgi:tetratricopeptide (TPR) repeat protein
LYDLAHTQCQRGDIAAINQLLVVAQEQHQLAQTLAENHPHRSGALLLLGELKMAQGELEQAEPLLRECLARRQADLPAGHRLIAYAQSMLGECLIGRGELDEAEQLLSESYDVLRREYGEHAAWAVDARKRMTLLQAARAAPAKSSPSTATSPDR